jgi:5-methylcytosine-specific restriction endonuclease McrA
LTVDHVIPRSRGGKSVWENIVAACASCNRRKGNRLPREIQMHPKNNPKAPGPTVFIQVASPSIPPAWQQYLPQAA